MSDHNGQSKLFTGIFKERIASELVPVLSLKFPYNINTRQTSSTVVASGTITQSSGLAVVGSGAATSSSAVLQSLNAIAYQAGQGVVMRFSGVFSTPVAGNTQLIGLGDVNDGLFIGYNGTAFGVLRRSGGVDSWIAQPDWNGPFKSRDFLTGSFDPTMGNIYQIQFQWLGFGNIVYTIYDPVREEYTQLHKIEYPNTATVPSISNPNLPLHIESNNTTNDTNIEVKSASLAAFLEGQVFKNRLRFAVDNVKAVTTELNILTIRNNTTFQSVANRATVVPDFITLSTDGNQSVLVRLYINATLGGTPAYNEVDSTNSTVSLDIAGTTITGGTKLISVTLSKVSGHVISLADLNLTLNPGDTLTIAASSPVSNSVEATLSWKEIV